MPSPSRSVSVCDTHILQHLVTVIDIHRFMLMMGFWGVMAAVFGHGFTSPRWQTGSCGDVVARVGVCCPVMIELVTLRPSPPHSHHSTTLQRFNHSTTPISGHQHPASEAQRHCRGLCQCWHQSQGIKVSKLRLGGPPLFFI